jgi:endogenous inhibitor of DNA gyrase (YacG/DUF329 family)
MMMRRRRYWCPKCQKFVLRVASTRTRKSFCSQTGQYVRLVWRPTQ